MTPLFCDFAQLWLGEPLVEWHKTYRTTIPTSVDKYLAPESGALALDLITKADIMAFLAKLSAVPGKAEEQSLNATRVDKIMMMLRMILVKRACPMISQIIGCCVQQTQKLASGRNTLLQTEESYLGFVAIASINLWMPFVHQA